MVAVTFRLSEVGRLEFPLAEAEPWDAVLQRCKAQTGVDPGAVISVRRGAVLGKDDLILDGDEVDVFPAISGG
jgi:molybdopterin converting factor small subunit